MSYYRNAVALVSVTCWLVLVTNGLPNGGSKRILGVIGSRFQDFRGKQSGTESSRTRTIAEFPSNLSSRFKRSSEHIVTECIFMTSEEGEFYYKASMVDGNACGIYVVAEPNQRIEIRFNYFDVPCSNGGLVAFVDGWELNGELFPSEEDYQMPKEKRFREFCDEKKIKNIFTSSSNVALIQYRMPFRGSGFTLTVKFIKNPTPCNVLLQGLEEVYTLKNYEKRSNCSMSVLFPSAIRVDAINVGLVRADIRSREVETGIIHKCNKRGLDDFVQIGGSVGLDNSKMFVADSVCGLYSRPEKFEELIACGTSTVRLVSSGTFDNSVTINLRQLDAEEDMNSFMSVICPLDMIQ